MSSPGSLRFKTHNQIGLMKRRMIGRHLLCGASSEIDCTATSEIGWQRQLLIRFSQVQQQEHSMTADTLNRSARNPFGTMDVPEPNGADVAEFAALAVLHGLDDDANAAAWSGFSQSASFGQIEGPWASRWNGGADPTMAGDTPEAWKPGRAELKLQDDRAYLLFDWDGGKRKGLIDARRDGATALVGKYINLTNPDIVRPWIGLIVSASRIDGRWTGGRLDFRR